MAKQNCWEFKKCGREPGGAKEKELDTCPAASEMRLDRVNSGKYGGRCCWAVSGTLCGGVIQGAFAAKVGNCMSCEFYRLVVREEGNDYVGVTAILAKLKQI